MTIRTGTTEEVAALARALPDFTDPYGLNSDPHKALPQLDHILVAVDGDRPIGFRAGHRLSEDTFAVWLAGVLPEYRRKGIAAALYREQNEWLRAQGYRYLRTHTRNSNRIMLGILVAHGYDVIGIEPDEDRKRNKVYFLKEL